MLLIGVNRSPYTRRVAITLKAYGMPLPQDLVALEKALEAEFAAEKAEDE